MSEIRQVDVDRMVSEAEKRGEERGRADMKRKIEEQAQCTICYKITTKVLQCPNGHLACQRCIERCNNECATCRCSLEYLTYNTKLGHNTKIRALAMEKLIDAVDLERKCRPDTKIRLANNISGTELLSP